MSNKREQLLKVQVQPKKRQTDEEDSNIKKEQPLVSIRREPDSVTDRFDQFIKYLTSDVSVIKNAYKKDVIGAPVFSRVLTHEMKQSIIRSPSVRAALEEYRIAHPRVSSKESRRIVTEIVDRMTADFHEYTLRYMAYMVQKILQQMYNGIYISQKELTRLKEVAIKAQAEGLPLVLVPTHKSHIDYLAISYVFFLIGLSLPFIAAGDNLIMPIVGTLLRQSGAFFIRRKFENDNLYKTIFNEYILTILSKGNNLEFFIEGGRSRTGKLMKPRLGVVSVIIDGMVSGRLRDVYMVPISIGYDKVVETPSYVKELLGANKEKESIASLLKSTSLLKLSFGRIDIRLGRPFSLKEFMDEEITKRKLDPAFSKDDKRTLVNVVGYSLMYRINKVMVAMPSAIIGTILLTIRARGITRKELIEKFEWLRQEILRRGGKVATPDVRSDQNTGQLVDAALNVLGSMISRQKNVLEPVIMPAKRFELSYYRNQIVHLFVNEGMIACSLYRNMRIHGKHKEISKAELLKDVAFLSQLLKLEVVYLPSPSINTTYDNTLTEMVDRGMLEIHNDMVKIGKQLELFDFICALFWPFIDSVWLSSCAVYALYPNHMLEMRNYLNRAQTLGFTLYYEGELTYYESISKEALANGLELFLSMNIVAKHIVDDKGLNVVKLKEEYQLGEKLMNLIEKIGTFRREGKYSSNSVKLTPQTLEAIQLTVPKTAKL